MAISGPGVWEVGNNWPWPRVFFTSYHVVVAALDGGSLCLYELSNNGSQWVATKTLVIGSPSTYQKISLADFGKYYIIAASGYAGSTLSVRMFARDPNQAPGLTAFDEFSSTDIPLGSVCCNYEGQLLIGNLLDSPSSLWSGVGSCAIAYSGIQNIEFSPEEDPSAGVIKMPWDYENQGKIYQMLQLEKDIIVYGDRGIEKLTPYAIETITGFGSNTIWFYGVLADGCVGTSGKTHCFIDSDYNLCLMQDKVQVLGYRKFMKTLDKTKIQISFEPGRSHFFISDGILCYVLTNFGLYTTHQCPTSLGKFGIHPCGFIKNNEDLKIRLTTTETDFGYQALKTVEGAEFGVDYNATNNNLRSRLEVKYNYKDSFRLMDLIKLNNEGILNQNAAGRAFRITLEGDYESPATAEFSLNSIKAKLKFTDKRSIRGRLNVS